MHTGTGKELEAALLGIGGLALIVVHVGRLFQRLLGRF